MAKMVGIDLSGSSRRVAACVNIEENIVKNNQTSAGVKRQHPSKRRRQKPVLATASSIIRHAEEQRGGEKWREKSGIWRNEISWHAAKTQ